MKKTIFVLLIALIVVAGCDLFDDDDDDNGNGAIGQILTVPGGTIDGWEGVAVLYVAEDEDTIFAGPIQVSEDGSFSSFEVGPIPSSSLEPVVVRYEDLTITNLDANTWNFDHLVAAYGGGTFEEIIREDSVSEVSWHYVDRDVRIHGELTMDSGTYDVDLNLKAGWNIAVMTQTGASSFRYRTESEPSGVRWILDD